MAGSGYCYDQGDSNDPSRTTVALLFCPALLGRVTCDDISINWHGSDDVGVNGEAIAAVFAVSGVSQAPLAGSSIAAAPVAAISRAGSSFLFWLYGFLECHGQLHIECDLFRCGSRLGQ